MTPDNTVRPDPTKKQVLLPSGKPLIPDYVFTFEKGKSKRFDILIGYLINNICSILQYLESLDMLIGRLQEYGGMKMCQLS